MAKNTFKMKKNSSLFARLERALSFGGFFVDSLPLRYVPLVLYVLLLALLYVGNTHYHEKMVRKTTQLEEEVAILRVDFTTLKADYMQGSKQSEVAKRVAPLGIYEVTQPPMKVKKSL